MTAYTELPLLVDLFSDHGISKKTEVRLHLVDQELAVECEDEDVAGLLAKFFGCPADEVNGECEFETEPHWHGHGECDARDLIIELIEVLGDDFDRTMTVKQLERLADN